MRYLITLLAMLVAIPVSAQITVTGTVKDINQTLYAGGTGRVVLNVPPDATQQPAINGNPIVNFPITIPALSSAAQFSITIPANNTIQVGSPSGASTTYTFSFCSAGYQNPNTQYCFTMTPQILNGSQDITAQIQSQAVVLPLPVTSLLNLNNTWTGFNRFVQGIGIGTSPNFATLSGTFSSPRSILLPDISGTVCLTVTCPGTAPGGSSGQIEYNNSGSFGGFTASGDCTVSVPTFTCTKTNGVAFANSATIDATNAGNLSAGTLPVGRLPTGIPNANLANSSVTVNTTSPLSGGGAVSLGSSITLACSTCVASSSVAVYSGGATCAMSGNVTVSTTATTTVTTCAVTMPAVGCPCRALINWGVTVDISNNNHIDFWVGDGTNSFRGTPPGGQTSDETGASGSIMTPVTYSNGANVTFSLLTAGAGSPNYTVKASPSVGGASSGMDVSVFTSN